MNKVKMFRSGANISQEVMAVQLGITPTTYRSKESGKSDFTKTEMIAFLKEIKKFNPSVTLDDIFLD